MQEVLPVTSRADEVDQQHQTAVSPQPTSRQPSAKAELVVVNTDGSETTTTPTEDTAAQVDMATEAVKKLIRKMSHPSRILFEPKPKNIRAESLEPRKFLP